MHTDLFRNAKYKTATLLLLCLAATMELIGISLIYPLIFLLFDLPDHQITFIEKIVEALGEFGLVPSKTNLIVVIICLLFFKAFCALLYRYVSAINVLSYERELREKIFFALFSKRGTQKDDIERAKNALVIQTAGASSALQNQFNLLQNGVMGGALLALGISLSPKLMIIAAVVGATVAFSLAFTVKFARSLGDMLAKENQGYVNQVTEVIDAYRYLKATSGYWELFKTLSQKIQNIYSLQIKFVILNRGTQIFSEPIVIASMAIVFYLGLVVFELNLALVLVVYVVLTKLYFQVLGGLGLAQSYSRDLVSVEYCDELLRSDSYETRTKIEKSSAVRKQIGRVGGPIDLVGVTLVIGGKQILEHASIQCPEHQLTVITGKTGTGKTTLLDALMGSQPVTRGRIEISGDNINDLDPRWFRSNLGVVTQEPAIFSMSVEENLRLRNSTANCSDLVQLLSRFKLQSIFPDGIIELSTMIRNGGEHLSGGEKQRLALIRELIASPGILLLDEVTSALDPSTTRAVLRTLVTLKKETTIVMVSHEGAVTEYADRIFNLNDGRIQRIK